jgi:hypothetical protein
MTTPKPFVRRSGLIAWLETRGFTTAAIDEMIRAEVIPRQHFPHRKRKAASRSKKSPQTIQGYAWYNTAQVAKALAIDL